MHYLLNQWMDFHQTCIDTLLGGGKGYTSALRNVQNRVSMCYLPNQWIDFDQTYIDTLLGEGNSRSHLDDLDLIFKFTLAL